MQQSKRIFVELLMNKTHSVTLIFPHQLFGQHPAVHNSRPVWLMEEILFFKQYNFHKQKLVLHRASMKSYAAQLQKKKVKVSYAEAVDAFADVRLLIAELAKQEVTEIHYADTVDNWLEKRIQTTAAKHAIKLIRYPSPNFLNQPEDVQEYFDKRKKYFQTDFYTWQRKQRKILLEPNGQPLGGKWTFDTENRSRFPRHQTLPNISIPPDNNFVKEAKAYIDQHFSTNYGEMTNFIYPVDHITAEQWLDEFLQNRFARFGIYEDAMVANEHFLYHSVLTPMLNIGLLQPGQIIDKAIAAAVVHEVPLNSLEGFIRQVMGWREFVRLVYIREGSKQRRTNYWGFTRKIPASFWSGTTGILPVDTVIKKVLKTGYSHHIERLMVLGNFMLLCEFDPDEVYRWFMELYADSYDWVMVPNVYGMTQFADGGLMTTKPYISGSNYLLKMGDWPKKQDGQESDWTAIWDSLFWRFMHVHRSFFLSNPRLGMLIGTFDKMSSEKRNTYLATAAQFLERLDHETKKES